MYTQDLKHLPFSEDKMKEKLEQSGVNEWAYIVHDKDKNEDGEMIRPHIHAMLHFKDAKTILRISKLLSDKPQYIERWQGSISNGYSYLLHETSGAEKKHHYNENEVISNFDFKARIARIRKSVNKPSKIEIENAIEDYSSQNINKAELESKIGVLEMAKRKNLIDHIDEILALKKHQQFLKEFRGQQCRTFWIWGETGVGKTKLCREVLEKYAPDNFCVLGSQRDHFQNYEGQNYVILNDLRPNDYEFGQLLTLLDPWENDKMAPARYHDRYLNAKSIFITTPYSSLDFYNSCGIANSKIDTLEQLKRRIVELNLTENNLKKVESKIVFTIFNKKTKKTAK